MNQATIKIGSYTLAKRGCELLQKNRIPCELRKRSDEKGQYGCLYSISVNAHQLWKAESILRMTGIMVLP